MGSIVEILNNRELALLLWITIAVVGAFFFKPFRTFLSTAVEIFTSKTFLLIFLLLIGYLILILYCLSKLALWQFSLLKDTVFWLVGVGFVIAYNSIGKDTQYFKNLALSSIKFTIILEFITNLHVMGFVFEFTTIPLLVFVGGMQAVNEHKVKDQNVGKFLNSIVAIYAITVFSYAIYKTIHNFRVDFSWEILQSLLLPSILTISFIPFSYAIGLYSAYENLFIKLHNIKNKKFSKSKIKWKLFQRTKLNLKKVKELNLRLDPYYLSNSSDIDQYLNEIEKPVANIL